MQILLKIAILPGFLLLAPNCSSAQITLGHLKTDPTSEIPRPFSPSVGSNRQLKTDPEIGEGYSFQLAPTVTSASSTTVLTGSSEAAGGANQPLSFTEAQRQLVDDTKDAGLLRKLENLRRSLPHRTDPADVEATRQEILRIERQLKIQPMDGSSMPGDDRGSEGTAESTSASDAPARGNRSSIAQAGFTPAAVATAFSGPGSHATTAGLTPHDWTAGIRNPAGLFPPNQTVQPALTPIPNAGDFTTGTMDPIAFGFGSFGVIAQPEAIAISRANKVYAPFEIYHQPLIQIKIRVIEVARANGTSSNSILEYVSNNNTAGNGSLTSGLPLNGGNAGRGFQNTRGISRFTVPGLISNSTTGSGLLVNLTSEHINWVASFLATELNADVITAPEVVTLNGQNVEFLAGEKVAFELGQNVISGTNNNIQQLFYKHVGTMVSVTPRIVNWGLYGEGDGEAPLVSQDIADWNMLCEWLSSNLKVDSVKIPQGNKAAIDHSLKSYIGQERLPVPLMIRSLIMQKLAEYSRRDLIQIGFPMREICTADACQWSPENCTIDVSLVVRLSDARNPASDPDNPSRVTGSTGESNVRAVANVVQLKSGHGVVMAGLIGERENLESTKIPGLGDIPYVGALFRSRFKSRLKTEVLVFVEARVLDSQPEIARLQSSHDYRLSQPFLRSELLDNPLERCLQRSGMAPYACDCGVHEKEFWRIHGREVRQAKQHINDILK